jgi:hypothetical protein
MVFEYALRCQANFTTCEPCDTAGNNIAYCEVCGIAYCSIPCKDWDSWSHLGSTDCRPMQAKKRARRNSYDKKDDKKDSEEMET